MATGLGPKIPLSIDSTDGIGMHKTIKGQLRENMRMLVLTSPGERVMKPDFGVGLYEFLFENATEETVGRIGERVYSQAAKWIPQVEIEDIEVDLHGSGRVLYVKIVYTIKALGVIDNVVISSSDLGIINV